MTFRTNSVPDPARPDPGGCIVVVTREFDGPDPERARRLIDTLFDGTADLAPPQG